MKKIRVAVLFGGRSVEHEVSIQSARNIIKTLNKDKYEIGEFLIPKDGNFDFNQLKKFDVVFPMLHGTFGEDGTVQASPQQNLW